MACARDGRARSSCACRAVSGNVKDGTWRKGRRRARLRPLGEGLEPDRMIRRAPESGEQSTNSSHAGSSPAVSIQPGKYRHILIEGEAL